MTTRRALLTLLACVLAGSAAGSEAVDKDEAQVLAAWINSLPFRAGTKVVMLHAEAGVELETSAQELHAALPQASAAVVEDFIRKNLVAAQLDIPWTLLGPDVRLRIVDDATLDALKNGPGNWWTRFYRAYPDAAGLTRLSRIGLDEATGQAVLMVSMGGNFTRGILFVVLLQRVDGAWKEVQSETIRFS